MASSSKRSRAAWVAAGLAAGMLVPAAALGTTTVSFSPSTGLLVTGDAAGEGLGVTRGADRFEIFPFPSATSPAAVLLAGSGCQAQETRLICPFAAADNRVVTANLGDGADLLLVQGAALSTLDSFIDGGPGNDDLRGGRGSDQVRGGPGDDVLRGGAGAVNDVLEGGDGNDEFVGDAGGVDTMKGEGGDDRLRALASPPDAFPGDLFDGGAGVDVADYSARTSPVFLRISTAVTSTPNDGAGAEGDDLDAVETLIGGAGGDTLEVDSPDTLTITPGPSPPPPPPAGPPGQFTLRGNGGADTLRALNRPRTSMDGGTGRDIILGAAGEDTIFSRDGERDKIGCGAALDTLTADLKDEPVPADCEFVNKSDRREGPNVNVLTRIARVDAAGVLRVRLACPRAARGGCAGALVARLDRPGTRFGAEESYSLRPGRSTIVAVTLRSGQIRGARRPAARVRVRSVEAGVHGDKTTQRSLAARRR
jgi:RTX calcium-binding nonapeptide repeat (4 copies)